MPDDRDVWNTTFYHCAIRKRISEELSRDHNLSQPLPNRIRTILNQLDEPAVESGTGKPSSGTGYHISCTVSSFWASRLIDCSHYLVCLALVDHVANSRNAM
jgi:hypothetical protein